MKFLHTADWHVGRKLHGYDLSTEQADALRKLEKIAIDEKVDAIVIAGDIYDRGMPSEDSVRMVNGEIMIRPNDFQRVQNGLKRRPFICIRSLNGQQNRLKCQEYSFF